MVLAGSDLNDRSIAFELDESDTNGLPGGFSALGNGRSTLGRHRDHGGRVGGDDHMHRQSVPIPLPSADNRP